jgi:hypothetical protein
LAVLGHRPHRAGAPRAATSPAHRRPAAHLDTPDGRDAGFAADLDDLIRIIRPA